MRFETHPRLTPLRAVKLLSVVAKAYGSSDAGRKDRALDEVATCLENRIRNAVVAARRRKRKARA